MKFTSPESDGIAAPVRVGVCGSREPGVNRPKTEWRRGSESVASSVVSASKMPYFADESSTTPPLPNPVIFSTPLLTFLLTVLWKRRGVNQRGGSTETTHRAFIRGLSTTLSFGSHFSQIPQPPVIHAQQLRNWRAMGTRYLCAKSAQTAGANPNQ